jgi:hypothetical protein
MGNGFVPARRDVAFIMPVCEAPIRPMIDRLGFIENKTRWAAPLRFGLVAVPEADFRQIATAMGVTIDKAVFSGVQVSGTDEEIATKSRQQSLF